MKLHDLGSSFYYFFFLLNSCLRFILKKNNFEIRLKFRFTKVSHFCFRMTHKTSVTTCGTCQKILLQSSLRLDVTEGLNARFPTKKLCGKFALKVETNVVKENMKLELNIGFSFHNRKFQVAR